ncbi:MAG TPA: hypothetical protein VL332_05540 [Candidatus Saccharimonadaceae bacterium]|jgi:hypothetical protein|nr:hypothetical protein [Candidatus Saccharimonadaceae bacterium]
MRTLLRAGGIAGLVMMSWATPRAASAADTQWWISDSPADYRLAEARGVLVRPDGSLGLGPATQSWSAESLGVIWAVAPLKDGSVALAGERGRIDRWTESGGVKPWVRLPVGQVLSLAVDGDGLMAGTGPNGIVYHVGARGDTSVVVRTGERYVWALAPGKGGAWYAASGTRGRLFRIERGEKRIVLDSDESNLVALLADGSGGVYVGGDSKGRVFHVTDEGARTVFDAGEDEVRGLAFGPDHALYASALSGNVVSGAGAAPGLGISVSAGGSAGGGEGDDDERAASTLGVASGTRAVVYRIVPDSSVIQVWQSPQPAIFALAGTREGVLVATGNRAGIYRVEAGGASPLLMVPQGQVTALTALGDGRVFAATSNPGTLWRLGPGRAASGEVLSATLDAKRIARFGRVLWRGAAGGGKVAIETRSGNCDPPDTTWSAWSAGRAEDGGARVTSPASRYLQWRIRLSGGDPVIESVEAAWRETNLPPRIEDLAVAPQGQGFREGELLPRTEPVTQTLPSGQKVEFSLQTSGTPKSLRDLPAWARGLRTLQWRASDPNGDALKFRVDVRAADGGPWMKVVENSEATAFTWDTNSLPDGRYRVRVVASDAAANAVGEERTAEAVSEPFTIDNTPPEVSALEAAAEPSGARVHGHARDGFGPLSRLDLAVDDGDWRPLTPEGGLTDAREAEFSAHLTDLAPGTHTLAVRAIDQAGNSATRAAQVTVTKGR